MCASQPKIAKNSLKPHIFGVQSRKVIDVGTPGKLVTYSPSGTEFPHKKLETLGYHTVKTRSLYLTCA